MTAQLLALQHPDLVRKLVLAETRSPGGDPEIAPTPDEWVRVASKPDGALEDLLYLFFPPDPLGVALGRASLQRTYGQLRGERPRSSSTAAQNPVKAIVAFYTNEGGWFQRLKDIRQPTLVANGNADLAFPMINSIILARQIPGATLLLHANAGHAFLFQKPDRFAADLSNFLRFD
jgi:pimeloyl-ACP methyl ester carboxylesterase